MLKAVLVLLLVAAACGGDDDATELPTATTFAAEDTSTTIGVVPTTTTPPDVTTTAAVPAASDECAHVVGATIESGDSGFTIAATVLSGDTGWDKYADAWQVWGPEGEVLGERILAHPHETEQPFTRSLSGVEIPEDVAMVTIAARDLVLGFCGDVLSIEVPRS